MLQNVKLAARMLLRTPFVTAVAVLSLALGIGANSAIFSLFDQILLRPLPVPAPTELVNLSAPGPKPGSQSCSGRRLRCRPLVSDVPRSREGADGPHGTRRAPQHGRERRDRQRTDDGRRDDGVGLYFPTLQLQAAGGTLTPSDDAVPGANYVTVLAHDFWRERFDADPGVIGRTLLINGSTYSIVGVAPEGFTGPRWARARGSSCRSRCGRSSSAGSALRSSSDAAATGSTSSGASSRASRSTRRPPRSTDSTARSSMMSRRRCRTG